MKAQQIQCFSKQTLTPSFIPLSIEDFGYPIDSDDSNKSISEESNGVLLSPKIHWFEAIIFTVLFLNLTFFLMTVILVYLTKTLDTNNTIIVAFLLSGLISLSITESLSIIYRENIKLNYNLKCSQMRVEFGNASNCWTCIRCFFLLLVFVLSVLSSVSIPFVINSRDNADNKTLSKEYEFNIISNHMLNEILFLLIFLSASLLITVTFWFILFGMFRFLCRHRLLKPSKVDIESGNRDNSKKSKKSSSIKSNRDLTIRSLKSNRGMSGINSKRSSLIEESIGKENSDKSTKDRPKSQLSDRNNSESSSGKSQKGLKFDSQSSSLSKSPKSSIGDQKSRSESSRKAKKRSPKVRELNFGTDVLEKEMKNSEKRSRLTTNSVIAQPTKSVGYINPEDFRLTESRIEEKSVRSKMK